jgi:acetylglutamate kinase
VIPTLSRQDFLDLKTSRTISGGMIPKLENAFRAIDSGVSAVVIGNAKTLPALLNGTAGTRIIHET